MDQVDFERLIANYAREYYASTRSATIPTDRGSIDLAHVKGTSIWMRYVLEDFAKFLTEEDVDSTTPR